MQYFAYKGYSYALTNNLQKDINQYLNSIDRTLIKEKDIATFKSQVVMTIEGICKQHPKCKPIKARWYKADGEKDERLYLDGALITTFFLYASK